MEQNPNQPHHNGYDVVQHCRLCLRDLLSSMLSISFLMPWALMEHLSPILAGSRECTTGQCWPLTLLLRLRNWWRLCVKRETLKIWTCRPWLALPYFWAGIRRASKLLRFHSAQEARNLWARNSWPEFIRQFIPWRWRDSTEALEKLPLPSNLLHTAQWVDQVAAGSNGTDPKGGSSALLVRGTPPWGYPGMASGQHGLCRTHDRRDIPLGSI